MDHDKLNQMCMYINKFTNKHPYVYSCDLASYQWVVYFYLSFWFHFIFLFINYNGVTRPSFNIFILKNFKSLFV